MGLSTAINGEMGSVMRGRRKFIGRGGGVLTLPFTAIAADGYTATVANPTNRSLLSWPGTRQGFTRTGSATTYTQLNYLGQRVRVATPNVLTYTANLQALTDVVLATDSYPGVANGSTRVSPRPIANWEMPHGLVVGNTGYCEVHAAHYFGMPDPSTGLGAQVALVRYRGVSLVDGTVGPWFNVNETTISAGVVEDPTPLDFYIGTPDLTALPTGPGYYQCQIFPWIGTVAEDSEVNQAAGLGMRYLTRRYFRKDVARLAAPNGIAVKPSTGNDATGVVSTDPDVAALMPCATIHGAIARANALLGDTRGCLDGLVIWIMESGAVAGAASFNAYKQDAAAIIITRHPTGVSRATANVSITANFRPFLTDHTTGIGQGNIIFKDCTVTPAAGASFQGEGSSHLNVQFWNCTIADSSQFSGQRASSHLWYWGATFTAHTSMLPYSTNGEIRATRSVTVDLNGAGHEPWNMCGCQITRASSTGFTDPTKDGTIWFNNSFWNPQGGASAPMNVRGTAGGQVLGLFSMIGNVVEDLITTDSVGIMISGDAQFGDVPFGCVVIHNTVPGQHNHSRTNGPYDEHPTVARTHAPMRFERNALPASNTKGLDHAANIGIANPETRIGNWAFALGVGCGYNIFRDYDAAGQTAALGGGASTLSFGPLWHGRGSLVAVDPLFVDYKAATWNGTALVGGAGGGDYRTQAGSPARGIAPHPILKYDRAGNLRGTGAQDAGAYQS